jgi:hypothetical protein
MTSNNITNLSDFKSQFLLAILGMEYVCENYDPYKLKLDGLSNQLEKQKIEMEKPLMELATKTKTMEIEEITIVI